MTDNLENLPEATPIDSESTDLESQSPTQQKTIARQMGWFMNDFLPWGLTGVGGAGAIHFLRQSQWLEAIVTFGVTLVVASWTKYSRGFVQTFSTIAGKRGEKDARSMAGAIGNGWKNVAETWNWYSSGFTKKYLKDQSVDCRDLDTEGFRPTDLRIPMLREVFVPLRLSGPAGREFSPKDLTQRELKQLQKEEQDSLDIAVAMSIRTQVLRYAPLRHANNQTH